MKNFRPFFFALQTLWLFACNRPGTLFEQIPSSRSGITFNNKITENDSINPLDVVNIYNGGGVGIGDFNNDGRLDIAVVNSGDNTVTLLLQRSGH